MRPPWSSRLFQAVPVTVLVALGVRAATVAALHGTPFTQVMVGDSLGYLETAERILAGRLADVGVFFQSAPLYPFVLAGVRALAGPGWLPVAAFQALIGSLACGALARTARLAFPHLPAAPWAAGGLAAFYGPLVFHDAEVLPASLAASLLSFGLLALSTSRQPRQAAVAGTLLGVAALLAPALLLVVAWAAVWLALRRRRAGEARFLLGPAALVAAAAAMVLPFTVHNLRAGDRVLISSNAGVNAYIGNNPEATGAFYLPAASGLDGRRLEDSAREAAEAAEGGPLRPSQVSAHWLGRARSWAVAEPLSWLRLTAKKSLLAINHYEIPNHLNFPFLRDRFATPLKGTVPFWLLFPAATLGGWLAVSRRGAVGLLVIGCAVACMAVPVMFFVTGRYRLPAAPPMVVLAGGAVAWLVGAATERAWRRVAAGVALILLLVLATRPRLVREGDYSFDHLLLGSAYRTLGDLDGAVLEFRLAEETGPSRSDAGFRLAQVLAERGNLDEAAAALRRHLGWHPADREAAAALAVLEAAGEGSREAPPRTDYERGTAMARQGDWAGARRAFLLALERDPAHWLARLNLGVVYDGLGNQSEAIEQLERAAVLAPQVPDVWLNLATAQYKAGRRADARNAARRAAELAPDDPRTRQLLERLGE